jgi:hypothetical protein
MSLMQAEAIRLFRWIERMNRPESDIGEFENQAELSVGTKAKRLVGHAIIEVLGTGIKLNLGRDANKRCFSSTNVLL